MTTPTPPAVTSWSVTGTSEYTEFAPDGTPVPGFRVSYLTGTGQSGTVFVARNVFSVDSVRAAIAPAAATLDAVAALKSGS